MGIAYLFKLQIKYCNEIQTTKSKSNLKPPTACFVFYSAGILICSTPNFLNYEPPLLSAIIAKDLVDNSETLLLSEK